MIASLLASAIALTPTSIAFALEKQPNEVTAKNTANGVVVSKGESSATLEIINENLSEYIVATVPLEIPIVGDIDGNLVYPENLEIINNGDKPLKVTSVTVTQKNGYKTTSYLYVKDRQTKLFNLYLNDELFTTSSNSESDSPITETVSWEIGASSSLPLDIRLVLSKGAYAEAHDKIEFATVQYTLAFA